MEAKPAAIAVMKRTRFFVVDTIAGMLLDVDANLTLLIHIKPTSFEFRAQIRGAAFNLMPIY